MQDRMKDLWDLPAARDFNEEEFQDVDINMDTLQIPAGLLEFNEQVERIKADINFIKLELEALQGGYRALLFAINTSAQEEKNREIESAIESKVRAVGQALKALGNENKSTLEHAQWRTNVHSLLTRKFMDQVTNFRKIQADQEEKLKQRIRERLLTVKPQATPEEIESIVEGGDINIFARELSGQNLSQAKEALSYVELRHLEILKLEASVTELYQLLNDLAILVESQGEFIDNIEENVAASVIHVKKANVDLAGAMKLKSRKRWCLCGCFVVCLLVILGAIITLIILGNASNWWISKQV